MRALTEEESTSSGRLFEELQKQLVEQFGGKMERSFHRRHHGNGREPVL